MKIGCINKNTNITEYIYNSNRFKNLSGKFGKEPYFQYEIEEGKKADMYTYNSSINQVELTNEYEIKTLEDLKCKIYRYVDNIRDYNLIKAPVGLDYVTGLTVKLYPKRTFVKGELQKVEWHSSQDYNDLIIKVDIIYERDLTGFATKRTTTRTWYREDGTEALPKKITEKVYSSDMISQIEEGQKRRGNLIKGLQIPMVGFLLHTVAPLEGESELERSARIIKLGRKFLSDNKKYFTEFIEDSNREITEVIEEATEFWMDNIIDANGTTIRQYILNEINIGGIE